MRRIALSLSIVASLAVLDACSGGGLGTGLSNTSSTTAPINSVVFQDAQSGQQANVFIVSEPQTTPPVRASNPILIKAIGVKTGGGVLGAISVPSVTFQWAAAYAPAGQPYNSSQNGSTGFCLAPPSTGILYPIAIDYPFAATTQNPIPPNGDSIDPAGKGAYALAALNPNNQTVNFYNEIAFFAPLFTNGGKPYCINLVATSATGVSGSVTVVVKQ
jgi:hypothetical protein